MYFSTTTSILVLAFGDGSAICVGCPRRVYIRISLSQRRFRQARLVLLTGQRLRADALSSSPKVLGSCYLRSSPGQLTCVNASSNQRRHFSLRQWVSFLNHNGPVPSTPASGIESPHALANDLGSKGHGGYNLWGESSRGKLDVKNMARSTQRNAWLAEHG